MGKSSRKVAGRKSGLITVTVDLETRGKYFDLQEIFDKLNREYFKGKILGCIVWGRRKSSSPRTRKTIRLGINHVDEKVIVINRALDRDFVPRYFLEYIVYHEMLHQKLGWGIVNGRNMFHHPVFLAEEKKFKRYAQALRWEEKNLNRLLRF